MSSFVIGVCNRIVEHLNIASELYTRLILYSNIELSVRLAPVDQVVQHLALQCSSGSHLQNLLLAVARISFLENVSSWSLLRSVLAGCRGREGAVAEAILQLANSLEAPDHQANGPPDNNNAQELTAFSVLTIELLRLTDESSDDQLPTHPEGAAATLEDGRYGASFSCGEGHEAGPAGVDGRRPAGDSESGVTVWVGARGVLERLEATSRAGYPQALVLIARAVSERLYPLDPGLACSWALQQVRGCCCCSSGDDRSSAAAPTAGAASFDVAGGQQRPQPGWAPAAASGCAPYLVAVLGLPLTLRTAEEELLRLRGRVGEALRVSWDSPRANGHHAAVAGAAAATAPANEHPLSWLLAAVAALGDEAEEAVWGMLGRVLAAALGGGGGKPSGPEAPPASDGAAGRAPPPQLHQQQHHQQPQLQLAPADARQAAAVLAVAEGVVLVGGSAESVIGVAGAVAGVALAGAADAGASRLETLIRLLLLIPNALPDGAAAQRRAADSAAAVRAVQMRIEHVTSARALRVYERVLKGACGGSGANAAAAAAGQPQQQQRRLLQDALVRVQSRAQYLAAQDGFGSGYGVGPTAAAGAPRGVVAGDPVFTAQCLADFTRQKEEHIKKMAGHFYRVKWTQGVKPVLLRPTLDEEAARLRFSYLKEANKVRLINDSELDDWKDLHTKLGLAGALGDPVRSDSGGGGDPAMRSPVDDLLRRLASVGPSLPSKILDAVMGALDAALAEELAPARQAALAAGPPAPHVQPSGQGSRGGGGLEAVQQQPVVQSASGSEVEAEAVAAHVAELVLEAFVAAEELESDAAAAAAAATTSSHADAAIGTAAAAAPRRVLRRRQSHLVWQLRLLDVVSRWPQLHAPLGRRLLQLTSNPGLCGCLDEAQVLGVAAALAAMCCVRVSRDAAPLAAAAASTTTRGSVGGEVLQRGGAAASARYVWQLSRCLAGSNRCPQQVPLPAMAERAQPVPGPALAQAALRALPLGPSPQQLRFSATFLAAYLRQCGLLESWALYTDDDGDGADGGSNCSLGMGARRAAPAPQRGSGSASDASWPAPVPVWVSPLVDGIDRRRRQQHQPQGGGGGDTAGCVPCVALRSIVWIQKYSEVFGDEVAGREGGGAGGAHVDDDGGSSSSGCWQDVVRVCDAFGASALGAAMLGSWAATRARDESGARGNGGGGGHVREPSAPAALSAVAVSGGEGAGTDVAACWDEGAMLRLTLRALKQGLQLPRHLMAGQAALLLRHLAPPPLRCPLSGEEAARGPKIAVRLGAEALGPGQEQQGARDAWRGVGVGSAVAAAAELGGLPEAKRVRAL